MRVYVYICFFVTHLFTSHCVRVYVFKRLFWGEKGGERV